MKIKTYSPFKIFLDKFFSNYFAVFGLILCIVLIFIAIFTNYISPQNPYDLMQLNILERRLPPGSESTDNDLIFYLGTDDRGRDILSAIFSYKFVMLLFVFRF